MQILYFNRVKICILIFSPICWFFLIFPNLSRFFPDFFQCLPIFSRCLPMFADFCRFFAMSDFLKKSRFFWAEKSTGRKNRDFWGHHRKIGDFFHYDPKFEEWDTPLSNKFRKALGIFTNILILIAALKYFILHSNIIVFQVFTC